jgi:hypothetical protein
VALSGHFTTNTTLTSDKRYLLTGFVYVDSLVRLTIEPGTIIYGDKVSKGALIVQRGAKIEAQGTPSAPIIFTSAEPIGSRAAGDWGGVIILGKAKINVPGGTAVIEGGVGSEYGGNDDADSSGVFSYVRIEFPGIAFLPNNEINGLTMGGVGNRTVIDHVQVSFSGDDSFEWFGGSVNCKYLIAYKGLDDDFDTDNGFSGKLQFLLGIRDSNIADISGSNGFESDNDAAGSFNEPRTKAWFSNVTDIGPQKDTAAAFNPLFRRGAHVRRSTQMSLYNSVVLGWPVGILVDGAGTIGAVTGDTLQFRNNIWGGLRAGNRFLDTDPGAFNAETWYFTPAYANRAYIQPDSAGLIDPFNRSNPDPRPAPGSPAASGASFSGRLTDPYFTPTTYVGAFDPNLPREYQWDYPWASYLPEGYNPVYHSFTLNAKDGWNLMSVPVENVDDSSFASIYPTAGSSAFSYGAGYVTATHATAGVGYWLKFTGAGSYTIPDGNQVLDVTVPLQEKWNMVGALGKSIPTSNIQTEPVGVITSSIYAYDPGSGYSTVTTLEPGHGHWIKTSAAGSITMSANVSTPYKAPVMPVDVNEIDGVTVTDAFGRSQTLYFGPVGENTDLSVFELPPPPPQGNFDARFASQRMVENIGAGRNSADIVLGSVAYPVTVTFVQGKTGATYQVASRDSRGTETSATLRNGGSVTINEAVGGKLSLRLTGEASVPAVFALGRSYPNPFNPTTRFTVDIPMASDVEVGVYNVLGQKVATLFSGVREAGSSEMTWNGLSDNAVSAPSGIYFIRMTAPQAGFSAMQKVTFLK